MEASYCTFGFGAIISARFAQLIVDVCLKHNDLNAYSDVSPPEKGNIRLTKSLGRLSYEKIWRYNNSPPYVMARWLAQQIPPLNFLGYFTHITCSTHAVLGLHCDLHRCPITNTQCKMTCLFVIDQSVHAL